MGRFKEKGKRVRYTAEFKVEVVRTALGRKLDPDAVGKLYEIAPSTWMRWKKLYAEGGEEALRGENGAEAKKPAGPPSPAEAKLRGHVLDVKRKYPAFGIVRVWQWLKRTLFLPLPVRFVRKTLAEEGLLTPVVSKRRAPRKIKRFERARPNQLWQSDITAFTLAKGLRVWLIGFMDDHSRYLVGWGLYAGQSGALVLEVFRNAVARYGRPQELLTDNGRQYKSWRGETDFQRELKREGIHHITSRPHHPQTLGKIEGFWGHMKREFLAHAVMGGLEDMRERLGHWIAFYNFQRPHAGIGGATPSERFFQYSAVAKAEIEKGVQANEKELAFRDPSPPSVVGQGALGDQAVSVTKDGGEFVVTLGGREVQRTDLDPNKENADETQEAVAGAPGRVEPGGPGEGGPGPLGAVGGEAGRGGVPGDGAQAVGVLQAGGTPGGGDGGGGGAAAGPPCESHRRGGEAVGSDGDAPDRAPAAGQPRADQPEALPGNGPERPGEAEKADSGGGASDGGAPSGAAPGGSASGGDIEEERT